MGIDVVHEPVNNHLNRPPRDVEHALRRFFAAIPLVVNKGNERVEGG